MVKVLYFASLRESLGIGAEQMDLPEDASVAGVMTLLRARGGPWSDAFDGARPVLVAVNQTMATTATPLADGDEIGLFPPVTGG